MTKKLAQSVRLQLLSAMSLYRLIAFSKSWLVCGTITISEVFLSASAALAAACRKRGRNR
jgi:hypothetical protein